MKPFWRGVARTLDIFGTMPVELPKHTDAEALAADWAAVGHDLDTIHRYRSGTVQD